MDSVVYVDQNAIFRYVSRCAVITTGPYQARGAEPPCALLSELAGLGTLLDEHSPVSKKSVKRKMRIGGDSLCEARRLGDVCMEHGIVEC